MRLFKSIIPVDFFQTKARVPVALSEVPTTTRRLLMPSARLSVPPGRAPRAIIPSFAVQRKAWLPLGPVEFPTTCPELLMPTASLDVSPGRVPRLCIPPIFVQRNARLPVALSEVPTMSPHFVNLRGLGGATSGKNPEFRDALPFLPEHGADSERSVRSAHDVAAVVDVERFAAGVSRERSQILHSVATGPKEGPHPGWVFDVPTISLPLLIANAAL
jgi:hypothetical protein